jgi:hypothetical protein
VILVSALVSAGLTLLLNLQKLVIIVLSAMAGASLCILACTLFFGLVTVADLQAGANFLRPIFHGAWLWGIVWLVLAVVGVLFQFRTNRSYEFQKEMYTEGWG